MKMRITRVDVVNSIGETVTIREAVINCPERRPVYPVRAITVEVGGEPKGVFMVEGCHLRGDERDFSRQIDPAMGLNSDEVAALVTLIGVEPGAITTDDVGQTCASWEAYPDPKAT